MHQNANKLQQSVTEIWTRLLRLEQAQPESGFLSSGGNSLKAMRLAREIRAATNLNLPLQNLIGDFTLQSLLQRLHELAVAAPVAELARESGEL